MTNDVVCELAHAAPVAEVLEPGAVCHTTAFTVDDGGGDEGKEVLVVGGSSGPSVSETNEVAGGAHETDAEETALREGGRLASIIGSEERVVDADACGVEDHRPVVSDALRADNVVVAPAFLPASKAAASR